jgi:hypothetical protein
MFIVCQGHVRRDMSHKIQLGHACGAGIFDDIVLLHPWWFVMFPPCQFWS